MKTALLMRHAKSDWGQSELSDRDRPLNARGIEDAPRMGRALDRIGVVPDRIVASDAERARRTAEGVARAMGLRRPVRLEPGLYAAPGRVWLEVLRGVDEEVAQVLVVAHSPGVGEAVGLLVDRGGRKGADSLSIHVPTAGIVAVDLAIERWSELKAGHGVLRWMLVPKLVKALATS